jgi:acetyl-CoA carboxylase biotin carboxyl carrier protein
MTDDLEPMAVGPGQEPIPNGVVEPPADAAPAEASTPPEVAADAPAAATPVEPPSDGGDRELLRLIDRLAALLDRSDLTELEVESGSTGLVLRKPSALAPITVASVAATSPAATPTSSAGGAVGVGEEPSAGRESGVQAKPSVKAPLTGIFYASPAPGSGPYVSVGGEVAVGQIIGLIEAMKLFNEIKSDLAGRVVRVVAESGTLVKAKQPLIEVEPL